MFILKSKATLPRWLFWAKKGGFAVLDQGLFAGANFLVNLLLARWLEPAQYGAFAVAYSVFLLLAAFYTAVITEPMLVFGAGKYVGEFRKYLGILIYSHWGITGIISLILGLTALVSWWLGSEDMAWAMAGLALSSPFILFLWLLRLAFYVRVQPQWAATGGVLYVVLMLAGMCGLYWKRWLSAALALLVMGLASLAVSLWHATLLRPQWRFAGSTLTPGIVLADHWRYGRWSASATLIMLLPSNIYYIISPIWLGLEGAAVLRVITTFLMPILNIFQAVSTLLFPVLAQKAKSADTSNFDLTVRRVLKLLAIASGVYFLLLLICGEWLINWLYGGRYQNYTDLLLIIGLSPFSYTITLVLGSALRVRERLHQVLWCYVISSGVTLVFGPLLMTYWGVYGTAVGFVISTATTAVAIALFYIIITHSKTTPSTNNALKIRV